MNVAAFVASLLTWEGVPYHHQGRTRAGVDCVGLALAALAEQGVHVDAPSNYHKSAMSELLVRALDDLQLCERKRADAVIDAGDVLVFLIGQAPRHVGIALDSERMIHTTVSSGVRSVTLSPRWSDRLIARYGWK